MASEGDFDPKEFMSRDDLRMQELRVLDKSSLVLLAEECDLEGIEKKTKKTLITGIAEYLDLEAREAERKEREKEEKEREDRLRAEEREDRLRAEEREDRLRAEEKEREDRLRAEEKEREKEEKEREERLEAQRRQLEHEREMERYKAEQVDIRARSTAPVDLSRVPRFCESEVEAFFLQFEKVASSLQWPEDKWAVYMQKELSGKAQEAYAALSLEQSQSYEIVKAAVLNAYELVPEAYRQRFRELKRGKDKTLVELAREKENLLDKWLRAKKVGGSYEHLRQLVLLEEFLVCLPPAVKVHVEERNPDTIGKAALIADEYELYHRAGGSTYIGGAHVGRPGYEDSWKNKKPVPTGNRIVCTICKKAGHTAEKCYFRTTCGLCHKSGHKTEDCFKNKTGASQQQKGKVKCWYCEQEGHVKAECHQYKKFLKESAKLSAAAAVPDPYLGNNSKLGRTQMKAPVNRNPYEDFLSEGKVQVGGEEASVVMLRDTGASLTLIRAPAMKKLADSGSLGKITVRGINGHQTRDLKEITLVSDMVSGKFVVGVVDELPMEGVDLLLGNDLMGGKVWVDSQNPLETTTDSGIQDLEEKYPTIFPSCVVTRSMASKMREQVESVSPEPPNTRADSDNMDLSDTFMVRSDSKSDTDADTVDSSKGLIDESRAPVGRATLIRKQRDDPSLSTIWDRALPEDDVDEEGECFFVREGVLMRKWPPIRCPANEIWHAVTQIVLPTVYRTEALHLGHSALWAGHLGIKKTQERILTQFYWPKMHEDIVEFCKTCHVGHGRAVLPISGEEALRESDEENEQDCVNLGINVGNSEALRVLPTRLQHLSQRQVGQVLDLFTRFKSITRDQLGKTSLVEHEVAVAAEKPIRSHPYRQNPKKQEIVRLMNRVTVAVSGCVAYVVDIVLHSDTWEDHLVQRQKLFVKLNQSAGKIRVVYVDRGMRGKFLQDKVTPDVWPMNTGTIG